LSRRHALQVEQTVWQRAAPEPSGKRRHTDTEDAEKQLLSARDLTPCLRASVAVHVRSSVLSVALWRRCRLVIPLFHDFDGGRGRTAEDLRRVHLLRARGAGLERAGGGGACHV